MKISDVNVNDVYVITKLDESDDSGIAKLTAMGIFPGVRFTIFQKKPVPVMKIGYTKFAIDEKLFGLIYAERED